MSGEQDSAKVWMDQTLRRESWEESKMELASSSIELLCSMNPRCVWSGRIGPPCGS